MTTLSIAVPEAMRQFVEQQAAKEGFASPDAYVQSLIRNAQQREAQHELEAKLLAGLNSGPATEMTSEDWAHIRREVGKFVTAEPA